MKKLLIAILGMGAIQASAQWTSVSPFTGTGSCWNSKDLIIDARSDSPNRYNRFGILHRGFWGSYSAASNYDKTSQYITLGPCDLSDPGFGPSSPRLYGFYSSMNTDRMFVGLRYRGPLTDSTACGTNIAYNSTNINWADAVIAWGNDYGTDPNGYTGMDKLKFMFYSDSTDGYTDSRQPRTIATMTPQGFMGIGTESPTAQLHTTGTVRFQGLTTGTVSDLVGIDANGNLFRTTGGGSNNSCATTNMVPKTIAANGALGCSQIFDNGTSVGINTTTGFTYSSLANSMTGSTLPPSSGTIRLDVAGVTRSLAYIATSDERLKRNITFIKDADKIIGSLTGHTYTWSPEVQKERNADGGMQYGFLAQEVEKILPEAVVKDENGYYGVNYNAVIPVLVESQKNLMNKYEAEKAANEELKGEIADLKSRLDALQQGTYAATSQAVSLNKLYQNTPNPFSNETEIKYELNQFHNNAYIIVYNMNGVELNRFLLKPGKSSITIKSDSMVSGMYMYSLIVDGMEADTKKMILTK